MKNINTIIYAAFCGTGKSFLCKKHPNTYKELECWEYRNGDFPNNYIKDVTMMLGKCKYLFISTDPVISKGLKELGIEVKLIYPSIELRNEYLDRYIDRDSPSDFIGEVMKNWTTWITELHEQNYCKQIELESGEYISDVLENN